MPRLYSTVMSKTLANAISDMVKGEMPQQQLSVYDELALIRHTSLQAVACYSAAVEAVERAITPEQKEKAQMLLTNAGLLMREALKENVDTAKQAAQIEALARDVLTVGQVATIIQQMIRGLYEVCGTEHMDIARAYDFWVKENVKLPTITGKATDRTPDQDVGDMDDTVPREPALTASDAEADEGDG